MPEEGFTLGSESGARELEKHTRGRSKGRRNEADVGEGQGADTGASSTGKEGERRQMAWKVWKKRG